MIGRYQTGLDLTRTCKKKLFLLEDLELGLGLDWMDWGVPLVFILFYTHRVYVCKDYHVHVTYLPANLLTLNSQMDVFLPYPRGSSTVGHYAILIKACIDKPLVHVRMK